MRENSAAFKDINKRLYQPSDPLPRFHPFPIPSPDKTTPNPNTLPTYSLLNRLKSILLRPPILPLPPLLNILLYFFAPVFLAGDRFAPCAPVRDLPNVSHSYIKPHYPSTSKECREGGREWIRVIGEGVRTTPVHVSLTS